MTAGQLPTVAAGPTAPGTTSNEPLLPAPIVPADVILRDFGFMPLHVQRLRDSDLADLSTGDEFKAAVLLWAYAWHQTPAASVPNDDRILAARSGAGPAWRKVKAMALRGFVECSDGRLYHPLIAEAALEAWARREEFQAVKENTESRQQRWRERQKVLSQRLRDAGVKIPRHASTTVLERLCEDAGVDTNVDGEGAGPPSHQRLTTVTPPVSPPVSPNVTPPVTPVDGGDAGAMRKTGTGTGTGTVRERERDKTNLLAQVSARPPAEPPPLALVDRPREAPKTGAGARGSGPPECPHRDILALWAEVLPTMPQHLPDQWRNGRAEHLRARWRETAVQHGWADQAAGLEYFRRLFHHVGKSRFLTGREHSPGKRPFHVELAWLVMPDNWAKTIEGKYHEVAA